MQEEINPWKILSQREVYDNKWINVSEAEVINPSGGKGIYGKVHFKNQAIGILVLDEQWNTWLVGQYRFTLNAYSWEIPEGGGPIGEDPLEAAGRELREETGLVAREWTQLMSLHLSNSVSDEYALIYLARGLEQHSAMPEETEQLQVKKIPFMEAFHLTETGLITDAMSVAAIQRVRLLQLEGKLF